MPQHVVAAPLVAVLVVVAPLVVTVAAPLIVVPVVAAAVGCALSERLAYTLTAFGCCWLAS